MFSEEEHPHHERLVKLLATSDTVLNEFSKELVGNDPTFKKFFS
jgi:hypothetical protein